MWVSEFECSTETQLLINFDLKLRFINLNIHLLNLQMFLLYLTLKLMSWWYLYPLLRYLYLQKIFSIWSGWKDISDVGFRVWNCCNGISTFDKFRFNFKRIYTYEDIFNLICMKRKRYEIWVSEFGTVATVATFDKCKLRFKSINIFRL